MSDINEPPHDHRHNHPQLALVADPQVDLSPLTQRLWANKIPHRVILENNQQCLLLADTADLPQVQHWVKQWQAGELDSKDLTTEQNNGRWLFALTEAPLAVVWMLVFIVVFIWMHLSAGWQPWLALGESLWPQQRLALSAYVDMGVWALWRPTLLHFSFLHLLMNMFWWWLLARPIERVDGQFALLWIILIAGVLGNMAQWWYAGPGFGGASGVTLAMLAWVTSRERRFQLGYHIPPILLPVMVGWLLLTLMGDTLVPGLSGTAHGAHFGGLIVGFVLALLWPADVHIQPRRGSTSEPQDNNSD